MSDEEYHLEFAKTLSRIETLGESTLEQVKKTNGRVTKLEGQVSGHDTALALINQGNTAVLKKAEWWKDKLGTALIALVFTAIGSGILLILQKTDILDVSVVSPEVYDQIDSYESNSR